MYIHIYTHTHTIDIHMYTHTYYTVLKIAVGHQSFSVQKFVGADIPVNSRPSCPSKMADRLHTI